MVSYFSIEGTEHGHDTRQVSQDRAAGQGSIIGCALYCTRYKVEVERVLYWYTQPDAHNNSFGICEADR